MNDGFIRTIARSIVRKFGAIEKLGVIEMRPSTLRKTTDDEVLSAWHRLNQLYGSARDSGNAVEDYVNAGVFVLDEMKRRKFDVDKELPFYKVVTQWMDTAKRHRVRSAFSKLPDEIFLIEKFVSIAGSQAAQNTNTDPQDTDLIIRADLSPDNRNLHLNWDLMWVALRRFFDPDKFGDVHYVPSAQGSFTDHIPCYDLVLRRRPEFSIEVVEKAMGFKPFDKFIPPKPTMMSFTEFFSVDELWNNWADGMLKANKRIGVEPKWKGFRGILEKKGDHIKLWFEGKPDIDQLKKSAFYRIRDHAMSIPDDFTLDCDVGIKKAGKFIRRNDLIVLNSDEPVLEPNEEITLTCFDLPYWQTDLTDKPFSFRRDRLEDFFSQYLIGAREKIFILSPIKWITNKKELADATKWAMDEFDYSEGTVDKTENGAYALNGSTNEWAKIKRVAEVKVIVLDKKKTKGGAYVYTGGLIPTPEYGYSNLTELNGKKYVNLGNSFSTSIDAKVGDTITVQIIELLPVENETTDEPELAWYGPIVQDVDDSRKEPYTVVQALDLSERHNVLEGKPIRIVNQENVDEGGTRSAAAARNWAQNWADLLPKKSNKGKFAYQHHWRGLVEDERNWTEGRLLDTDNSVHGDLRMEADDHLWGLTIFLGRASDVKKAGGDRLDTLKPDDSLQIAWKLVQPKSWLDVGKAKPLIVEPGGIAASKNLWGKFFIEDSGEYEITYAKEHFIEVFLYGNKLKGRYIFEFAPVGEQRIWIIRKPDDQTPYIEGVKLEDEVRDQKSKGRKWIYFVEDSKPVIIDLVKAQPEDFRKEDESRLAKAEIIQKSDEKQIVLGIVLVPDKKDAHGDTMTTEDIEQTAHNYLVQARTIGLMHKVKAPAVLVESFIAPVDMQIGDKKVNKGSWLVAVKVLDSQLWNDIKSGVFKAFSVGGWGKRRKINKIDLQWNNVIG